MTRTTLSARGILVVGYGSRESGLSGLSQRFAVVRLALLERVLEGVGGLQFVKSDVGTLNVPHVSKRGQAKAIVESMATQAGFD